MVNRNDEAVFAQTSIKSNYTLGMSVDLLEDVNIKDAKVTLDLWTKLLASNMKEVEKLDVIFINGDDELLKAANKDLVDILYISSLQYLKNTGNLNIVPLVKTHIDENAFYDIVICSYKGSNINDFLSMKDKKILVQGGKYKKINELWLDLLCLQNGITDRNKFFRKVEFTEKPLQTVLPVFLKKTDLCLVNSGSLEILSEMNPQILKSLEILFKRTRLTNDLICVNKNLSEENRKLILNFSINHKKLPKTDQIYKIFKTFGASEVKESDLNGIRSLFNEYQDLVKKKQR